MTKFDKVLQGLRCCKSGARDSVHDGALRACHKCPYAGDYPCTSNLAADTLELFESGEFIRVTRCGECKYWRHPESFRLTLGRCILGKILTDANTFCKRAQKKKEEA